MSLRKTNTELRADMLLPATDFGTGYALSKAPDKKPYLGPPSIGQSKPEQYAISSFGPNCRPAKWSVVVPTRRAFEFVDAPDGGAVTEELYLFESEADAQAIMDSARFTLGAAVSEPACEKKNLIAPSEGAAPDTWTLRFPIVAIDAHCGVGDDCHAVVTQLDPCVGEKCTPVTQVYFRVSRILASVMYSAPPSRTDSVPVADLLPASKRAEALLSTG